MSGLEGLGQNPAMLQALRDAGMFWQPSVSEEQVTAAQKARDESLELMKQPSGADPNAVLASSIAAALPMLLGYAVGGKRLAGAGAEGTQAAMKNAQTQWTADAERQDRLRQLGYTKAESDYQNILNKQIGDQQKKNELVRSLFATQVQDDRAAARDASLTGRFLTGLENSNNQLAARLSWEREQQQNQIRAGLEKQENQNQANRERDRLKAGYSIDLQKIKDAASADRLAQKFIVEGAKFERTEDRLAAVQSWKEEYMGQKQRLAEMIAIESDDRARKRLAQQDKALDLAARRVDLYAQDRTATREEIARWHDIQAGLKRDVLSQNQNQFIARLAWMKQNAKDQNELARWAKGAQLDIEGQKIEIAQKLADIKEGMFGWAKQRETKKLELEEQDLERKQSELDALTEYRGQMLESHVADRQSREKVAEVRNQILSKGLEVRQQLGEGNLEQRKLEEAGRDTRQQNNLGARIGPQQRKMVWDKIRTAKPIQQYQESRPDFEAVIALVDMGDRNSLNDAQKKLMAITEGKRITETDWRLGSYISLANDVQEGINYLRGTTESGLNNEQKAAILARARKTMDGFVRRAREEAQSYLDRTPDIQKMFPSVTRGDIETILDLEIPSIMGETGQSLSGMSPIKQQLFEAIRAKQ